MKPEEYLMQHYRYWTIPDLGLSEDERGYVEALRIGAEAIKEVERLRAKLNFLETAGKEEDGWCEHERRYQRTSGGDGDHLCAQEPRDE